MNDKSALLSQLKLDRESHQPPARPLWPWLLGAAALIAFTGLGFVLLSGDKPVSVTVAIATAPASAGGGGSVLDASGYVVARRQATVSSKVTGKVVDVLIEEGQEVKADQVLARIDDSNTRAQLDLASSQLDAARAQQAEVRVQLADAERTLTRNRDLADKKLVSQQQLDSSQAQADALRARLESTQRNVTVAEKNVEVQTRFLNDTVVRAPFDGVITQKNAQPGEMISPLSAGGAGTLVDMSSLEVEVDVNENFIVRVQPGQAASAKLNAYPDWNIPAEVIAVIPTADRSKATVKVRVKFQQLDPRILPDMGVRVSFLNAAPVNAPQQAPRGVLLPATAVLQQSGDNVAYAIADGQAQRRILKLDGNYQSARNEVLVLDGLIAGEAVASSNLTALQDGSVVFVSP